MAKLQFGRYVFEATNEKNVLFPDGGITKGYLIAYNRRVAAHMIPHISRARLGPETTPGSRLGISWHDYCCT